MTVAMMQPTRWCDFCGKSGPVTKEEGDENVACEDCAEIIRPPVEPHDCDHMCHLSGGPPIPDGRRCPVCGGPGCPVEPPHHGSPADPPIDASLRQIDSRETRETPMTTKIVRYCAQECEKQQTGPLAVADMYDAWDYALSRQNDPSTWLRTPNEIDILAMARMIDTRNNSYRCVPVTFDNGEVVGHQQIARLMTQLIDAIRNGFVNPSDAYQEFERIHPFIDGNGRLGAILYNWLNRSLYDPQPTPVYP